MAADASSLHEHAVEAEKHLEALATGLAQAGVEDSVVQTVTKCAEVARKVVKVLGKGQEATGDEEPPVPEEEPAPAAAPQAPAATSKPSAIDDAVAATHQDQLARVKARRQQRPY